MPFPTTLPIALSLATVEQTLTRVEAAANYAASCGSTDELAESIRLCGVTAYSSSEEGSRDSLKKLIVADPRLHAVLEESASRIERSIGVELPLILPVVASLETPHRLPSMGMALLLDRLPEQVPKYFRGLQIFHLTRQETVTSAIPINRFRKTTPRTDDGPASREIADLAQRDLKGHRAIPLSSGDVALRSRVAHVGRFSFLGFDDLPPMHRGILQSFSLLSPTIDVLALGGYFATHETEAQRYIQAIRPRIALVRTNGPSELISEDGDLIIARLNPREPVTSFLELNPKSEILRVTVGSRKMYFHAQKADRWRTLTRARQDGVLKGGTLGDGILMNRVVKYASRYLDLLESSPGLNGRTPEKAGHLRNLIDELLQGQRDPERHIEFFSKILLASGVLT